MIGNRKQARVALLSRTALRAALALGLMGSVASVAVPAMAANGATKISLSKTFQPVAVAASKAFEAAKTRADVVAARANVTTAQATLQQARGSARAAAQSGSDAAMSALAGSLAAEKTQLDNVFAAATSPDDRYMAGNLAISLGDLARDTRIQRRGLEAMLGSGKVAPADAPRLNYYLGQFAFDQKDFAGARTALQAAITSGFHENDVDGLLAEAYLSDNQVPQGLTVLKQAIDARNATPNKAPAGWYRRGLGAAYNAKLLDQAADFAMSLVKAYPTAPNWSGALTVVREIGHFPPQETLDIMRLMDRTKSYVEERDYIEYIQAADARRYPGEVLKVIDAGVEACKLRFGRKVYSSSTTVDVTTTQQGPNTTRVTVTPVCPTGGRAGGPEDPFVVEAFGIASARVAADRASLPALERDARAPAASAVTTSGAADAFLSYGDSAKAEALSVLALTKPGVDRDRMLTRMGIAQLDQGNFAGAQDSFGKVGGTRKYIAQLWSIYTAQKAAPPVAAPAAQ